MSEAIKISIVDKDGNYVASVVPTDDDPTVNGLVVCNPDGSSI